MKKPFPTVVVLCLLLAKIQTASCWAQDVFGRDDDDYPGGDDYDDNGKDWFYKGGPSPAKKGGKYSNPWKKPPSSQSNVSGAPTRSPSRLPTTKSPVANPTIAPVFTPTIHPTDSRAFDTAQPTQVDPPLPTDGPTTPPVLSPTLAPYEPPFTHTTDSPTVPRVLSTPTTAPTTGNVPTLSPATTLEANATACVTQGNLFGSSEGDPRFLDYGYELETRPDEIPGSMSAIVLPPLEVAFNNFLLPELFPQNCSNDGAIPIRGLLVLGISALPADEPRPEVVCKGPTAPGNSCLFMRGSLIAFVDENEDLEPLEDRVRARLKVGMDANAFVSTHPSIVRVTYVETGIDGLPTLPPETDVPREGSVDVIEVEGGADDDDLVLPIVLGAAACIIIAVGAIVARRFSE